MNRDIVRCGLPSRLSVEHVSHTGQSWQGEIRRMNSKDPRTGRTSPNIGVQEWSPRECVPSLSGQRGAPTQTQGFLMSGYPSVLSEAEAEVLESGLRLRVSYFPLKGFRL